MAAAETARLVASLELQDKNFTRGLKAAEKRLGHIDKRLGAFSGAVNRNLARGVDSLVSHGIEAGQTVIQAAVDQESAITGIAKTVNGNIDAIVDDLKRLSTETGSTFTELAGIAELGGAMGIAKDDLTAFTEQVAILGATTDVSTEDAATALGQLQNLIGLTGDEFDNFAASLVDLGNKGSSTESQILEIAKRSGAAAKLVGVAKDETLAWASAAANLGLNSELAGTALQNFFLKGATSQEKLAKVAGVSTKKFKKLWAKDATGAMQVFLKELGKLDQETQIDTIQSIFGKGSGLTRLILGLAGDQDNLTQSLNDGTEAWEKGTAAQAEADKRFATSEFAFKRLNNSVNLAAATIGTELLPVLVDLAEEGMAWLNEPATQKALKSFAKDLGKGLRGLASTIRGIDWGGIAGALSGVAGIGLEIIKAFTGLPAWAQAFLIGGFAANKFSGGAIGSVLTDMFKGALGIKAGVVHVSGPIAGMPGGAAGGGAAAGGGKLAGILGKFGSAAFTLGTVFIAGASIVALAETFQGFMAGTKEQQDALDRIVENSKQQNLEQTLANLNGTAANLRDMAPWDRIGAEIWSGAQMTENFEAAAERIATMRAKGQLSREDMVAALKALEFAREEGDLLTLPKTDAEIAALTKKLATTTSRDPKQGVPSKPTTVTIKPGDAMFALFATQQQATKNSIDNAKSIATRENQKTNAAVDDLRQDNAAKQAANKAAIDRAKAVTAQAGRNTTSAASTAGIRAAGAARNAGATTAGAMAGAASRIVAALYATQTTVQSTNVIEKYTTIVRTGSTSGSRRSGPLEY